MYFTFCLLGRTGGPTFGCCFDMKESIMNWSLNSLSAMDSIWSYMYNINYIHVLLSRITV